jgi:hypothetical protein
MKYAVNMILKDLSARIATRYVTLDVYTLRHMKHIALACLQLAHHPQPGALARHCV